MPRKVGITGLNNVIINSSIGEQSNRLQTIDISSTEGKLTIERVSGRIVSNATINLQGKDVDVLGVVRITAADGNSATKEVTIKATRNANLMTDLISEGSVLVEAGDSIAIYNAQVIVKGANETLSLIQKNAGGEINLSRTIGTDGKRQQQGALLTAIDGFNIQGTGTVNINAGVQILTNAANSKLNVSGGTINLVGSLQAGATIQDNKVSWSGKQATVNVTATDAVIIGGMGADESGQLVARGGSIEATGEININVQGGANPFDFSLSALSFLKANTLDSISSRININTVGDAQVYGSIGNIQATDNVSEITIKSQGLLLVDGYIKANNTVTLDGGRDANGYGLIVNPLRYRDSQGRLVDANSFYIDAFGNFVDATGNLLAAGAKPVSSTDNNLKRESGGTLDTNDGGTISLAAEGNIHIQGAVGPIQLINSVLGVRPNTVFINSRSGDVTVTGIVGARNQIGITSLNLNIINEAQVKTYSFCSRLQCGCGINVDVATRK